MQDDGSRQRGTFKIGLIPRAWHGSFRPDTRAPRLNVASTVAFHFAAIGNTLSCTLSHIGRESSSKTMENHPSQDLLLSSLIEKVTMHGCVFELWQKDRY